MEESIPEMLNEEYDKLWNGEPVNLDVAKIYYKEQDGFFAETEGEAVGMHPENSTLVVAFYDIEDGDVICTDNRFIDFGDGISVRLSEMLQNMSNAVNENRGKRVDSGLGYIG